MSIETLQREIEVTHYRLGMQTFVSEIQNGFPLLGTFEELTVPRLLVFLKSHSINDQIRYATALVKRRNQKALSFLGELLTEEDKELIEHCSKAILIPTITEIECDLRRVNEWANIKIDMQDFRKAVLKELCPIFGDPVQERSKGCWTYKMLFHDWIVETEVDTAGRRHILEYNHSILSIDGATLKQDISVLSLLGISGQTYWWRTANGDWSKIVHTLGLLCSFYTRSVASMAPWLDRDD